MSGTTTLNGAGRQLTLKLGEPEAPAAVSETASQA